LKGIPATRRGGKKGCPEGPDTKKKKPEGFLTRSKKGKKNAVEIGKKKGLRKAGIKLEENESGPTQANKSREK